MRLSGDLHTTRIQHVCQLIECVVHHIAYFGPVHRALTVLASIPCVPQLIYLDRYLSNRTTPCRVLLSTNNVPSRFHLVPPKVTSVTGWRFYNCSTCQYLWNLDCWPEPPAAGLMFKFPEPSCDFSPKIYLTLTLRITTEYPKPDSRIGAWSEGQQPLMSQE